MHLALFSIALHLEESVESINDESRAYTRLEMLLMEARQRGGDWAVYRDDSRPFDWDIVDHQETEPERIERLSAGVRSKRDSLLLASDRYLLADWPIPDDSTRSAWTAAVKAYRQALRDLPTLAGFPESITWPVNPQTGAPDA